jgi:4-amino-4-deoxy-L-arabinose transferase-like glycosyltransferase
MHVRESHYVLTDVPATFLVMLTLLLSLRAHERSTAWSFALAGLTAGLAGATKYNGVLAVLMPIIACLMTPATRPSRQKAMLWIVTAMLAAFFVAAPYTFLDLPTFLNQFARLSSEFRSPPVTPEPIWQIYLKYLRNSFTPQYFQAAGFLWPGTLIVIGGFALGVWRTFTGPERLKWMLVVIFPLVYFRFISNQNIFFGRYLLPLIPFLSILAAAAVVWCVDWMRRRELRRPVRNLATVALTLTAIVPPAYSAIQYDANAAKVWTTEQAYHWIQREIPAGSHIRLEGSLAIKLPAIYKTSYGKQLRLDGIESYSEAGIHYLVASSQCYGPYFENPGQFPAEYRDYQRIFAASEEVARFKMSSDHPGPELIILKVKP